jgi:RNA polymerase sigma factor (sigma-70 family)
METAIAPAAEVPFQPLTQKERFERLFDDHGRSIHRYFQRRASRNEVEDLTADVFAIAWRRIDEIPEGFAEPWLYRTAWNVLANARRKYVDIPIEELEISAPDLADDFIEDDELKQAWQQLSIRDREVLRLAAWEGLNGEALAAALGISVGGAGAALSRARERFQLALTGSNS